MCCRGTMQSVREMAANKKLRARERLQQRNTRLAASHTKENVDVKRSSKREENWLSGDGELLMEEGCDIGRCLRREA